MKSKTQERRKIIRLPDSLVVRHRPFGSKTDKERSVSKNLSSHGIALPIGHRMSQDAVLEMEILIPTQILPVFALGEIVWMKEEWENARRLYDVGIRITDIDEFDEERIQTYLQKRAKEATL
jgi:hypothetical protein